MKRQYDPLKGRFDGSDPSPDVEGQESLSTYQYGWNNPILKSDPNGDFPCCDGFMDYVAGAGAAVIDNATNGLVNLRGSYTPSNPKQYNRGQDAGDLGSMMAGAYLKVDGRANIVGGTEVVVASVTLEVGSGGVATLVAGPGAAVGATMMAKGGIEVVVGTPLLANGSDNFKNQKGRVNEDGKKNNPKKEAREQAREKRDNQPASEKRASDSQRDLTKREGRDASRKAHDVKKKGEPDRTTKQLKEDYGTKW